MLKRTLSALILAATPAAFADPQFQTDQTAIERDRSTLLGLRLSLPLGARDHDYRLQFGAHYDLDGRYEFAPIMSFRSKDGLAGLQLEGADETDGEGGDNTMMWVVGGGALLLVAAAAGSGGSDAEEVCIPDDLLRFLECIDDD